MESATKPSAVQRAQEWLEAHESDLIEDLRTMLRFESLEEPAEPNAPFGKGCRQALDFALKLGESWGMRTRDVEGYAGHAEFGDSEKLIMALGHLDVVPVGDGWKHDPFGAEIDSGYIYARGAEDDKGPTMATFYAARALKETGADLPARIRVVFGCNEESGFACVKKYFSVEEAPTFGIAPDSGWPLYHAEKGIANIILKGSSPHGPLRLVSLVGGQRPNIVIDKAEAVIEIAPELLEATRSSTDEYWDKNVTFTFDGNRCTISALGKAAHGSTPFAGDSAAVRILRAVAEFAPPEQSKEYSKLLMLGHPSGVGLGIHGEDIVSQDLTSNIGIVETENERFIFTVNVRYPVTWTGAELREKCERYLRKELPSLEMVAFDDSPPLYFPVDQEPVTTLVNIYRQETGDDTPPGVMGGGTYARAVPNTVSVGTGWDGDGPAHQNDERIHVSHPLKMAKIYAHMLYGLAQAANK